MGKVFLEMSFVTGCKELFDTRNNRSKIQLAKIVKTRMKKERQKNVFYKYLQTSVSKYQILRNWSQGSYCNFF